MHSKHFATHVRPEALVFDRRSKNFLTLYNTCCGITPGSVTFSLSSFAGGIGFIGTASSQGDDYCGGGPVELPATFSSSNPAISSVSSGGNVSGVSPGSTFTNTSVTYSKQKTVDSCTPASQSNSAPTTVQAIPTNFRLTTAEDVGDGYIQVTYRWDSSTGNLADLGNCFVGELTTYPGENPYQPPSPPWPKGPGSTFPNPTIPPDAPGSYGTLRDNHLLTNLNFVKPYSVSSFVGTQYFRYTCAGAPYVILAGPFSIKRELKKDALGRWVYVISKTGTSTTSTYVLINQ